MPVAQVRGPLGAPTPYLIQVFFLYRNRFPKKLTRSRWIMFIIIYDTVKTCRLASELIKIDMIRVRHTCFTEAFTRHRYRLLGTRNMSSITTHPSLRKVSTESTYSF
jgi:hypothetical protein